MSDSWWRDLFRLRCAKVIDFNFRNVAEETVLSILICKRWRFHRGSCK